MDEEGGVKAPVTRLRRRLSVEPSEETKSPAPNTPTKKRGGRRAAKPELDLIDENAPQVNTPKKTTKKTALKEIEIEEKPVTPSRRSTRIKSNTSIVSETIQTFDSPRAKRAARRTSQVGSDNEAPLTPARQTRRTRKDSGSTEQQPAVKLVPPITDIIKEEELEHMSQKSLKSPRKSIEQIPSPSVVRKSPRLSLKKNKDEVTNEPLDTSQIKESQGINTSNKENETTSMDEPVKELSQSEKDTNKSSVATVEKLSESSTELLNQVKMEPKNIKNVLSKSTSATLDTQNSDSKRHRTKSWTNLNVSVINDEKFFSDSESVRKKRKSLLNTSNNTNIDLQNSFKNNKLNTALKSKRESTKDDSTMMMKETESEVVKAPDQKEEQKLLSSSVDNTNEAVTSLFEKEPNSTLQAMVYIDESDSNSEKPNVHMVTDDEDQCVPVIKPGFVRKDKTLQKEDLNIFNLSTDRQEENISSKNDNKNDSVEPMDIDETIPDNLVLNKSDTEISGNKASESKNHSLEISVTKESKRKSSLTLSSSQNHDKIINESKSTLILSELKDISNENNILQSPQISTNKLSKSDHTLNVSKDKEVEKKSHSSNYLTSTPLHQKSLLKLAMQMNTSDILSNNSSKLEKSDNKSDESKLPNKSEISVKSASDEESEDDESEQNSNKLIDDEAEEASDNYESGDSKDEEEEQYEREHEIIQKGETLTSEDDVSNDTDYEKDSFVVSSDEDDDDLLDGSSDDLSMSDNELKMTEKSKKKYNERKMKEQKKASREMFESRHKLNMTSDSLKSELSKVKKKCPVLESSESDDEDIKVKVKKNNKRTLDSSHESSVNKTLDNSLKAKESNLTKSINESKMNEVEMTIIEESTKDEKDPLSTEIKKEPHTPQTDTTNTSIKFIDLKDAAENDKDKSKSNANQTHLEDPLESNASDSDSSDNIHIQNYDSVLSELNKSNKANKKKITDISLNLDKKTKQKTKPIFDELNLTQVKSKKPQKNQNETKNDKDEVDSKTTNKSSSQSNLGNMNGNESPDSIDFHLLFSEESNSIENADNNDKEEDSFIPLKQTPGKMNILDNSGHKDSKVQSSKKNNKKRKTLDKSATDNENNDEDIEVQFFIDTTGTHNSTDVEKSFNKSEKNVKQIDEEAADKSLNMSVAKTPKSEKKKQKRLSESQRNEQIFKSYTNIAPTLSMNVISITNNEKQEIEIADKSINKSLMKTPKSEKKKKKLSESLSGENIVTAEKYLNKSVTNTPSEKKKKKLSESQSDEKQDESISELKMNTSSVGESATQDKNQQDFASVTTDKSMIKTPKSEKKKKKLSESQSVEKLDESFSESRLNISSVGESATQDKKQQDFATVTADKSVTKTPKSEKKKKKLSESQADEKQDELNGSKLSMNIRTTGESATQDFEKETVVTDEANKSFNKIPRSDKKKAKKLSESQSVHPILNSDPFQESHNFENQETDKETNLQNVTETSEVQSKKRKRKSSLNQIHNDLKQVVEISKNLNEVITNEVRSKKRKISHNIESLQSHDEDQITVMNIQKVPNQSEKQLKHTIQDQDNNITSKKKRSKKRKVREDDEEIATAKVLKTDFINKGNVPRLTATILNQLEDKPKTKKLPVKKPEAISTSSFTVEETRIRKLKPSNYLEESIYLNDDELFESKKPKRTKIPKVLPFLPTASTSSSGFTTNFKVNVIPSSSEFKFVAKSSDAPNFRNDFLENKKKKRFGTYELYKRNRNVKLSKF